ncbi:uncharacterized protein LOC116159035 [Photinus pyralis]|uniref:uncharacterized protein LOC116159035 n=1 Tax=Photinus pyralis TaxID=7054 RepID=UPI0012672D9C|nr:uncharacterized protein LOC116159035 [Photinus pyralis]
MALYEREQARLAALMEECLLEDDNDVTAIHYDDASDPDEEDILETDDHNSDTEQDISDDDVDDNDDSALYFLGKDNQSKWNKHCPRKNVRTRAVNKISDMPGAKPAMKGTKSVRYLAAFS